MSKTISDECWDKDKIGTGDSNGQGQELLYSGEEMEAGELSLKRADSREGATDNKASCPAKTSNVLESVGRLMWPEPRRKEDRGVSRDFAGLAATYIV